MKIIVPTCLLFPGAVWRRGEANLVQNGQIKVRSVQFTCAVAVMDSSFISVWGKAVK